MALSAVVLFAFSKGINAWAEEIHNPVDASGKFAGYSYVWFGSYPQSEVFDKEIIEKIDAEIGAESGDCWVDGYKYRKMQEKDCVRTNNWGKHKYRYFRWERLKWRVLNVDETTGKLFVMADKALDSAEWDSNVQWDESRIRRWLNGLVFKTSNVKEEYVYPEIGSSFYSLAFTDTEQMLIYLSQVEDNESYFENVDVKVTNDKIFLLSYSEATDAAYGFEDSDKKDSKRVMASTDYAKVRGVAVDNNGIAKHWTLRSNSEDADSEIMHVDKNGRVGYITQGTQTNDGIVPVMVIDYDSSYCLTQDDGNSGLGGMGSLRVRKYNNPYKKLILTEVQPYITIHFILDHIHRR